MLYFTTSEVSKLGKTKRHLPDLCHEFYIHNYVRPVNSRPPTISVRVDPDKSHTMLPPCYHLVSTSQPLQPAPFFPFFSLQWPQTAPDYTRSRWISVGVYAYNDDQFTWMTESQTVCWKIAVLPTLLHTNRSKPKHTFMFGRKGNTFLVICIYIYIYINAHKCVY